LSVYKKQLFILFLLLTMFIHSGCALLQVPFTLVGGTFKLVGKLLQMVDKLPKPPPGVFGPF
jgi:hypothetical protein